MSKIAKINSLIIAIFLSLTCVASMVNSLTTIPYASIIISLILLLASIFCNKEITFSKISLSYYVALLILLVISLIINGDSCCNYLFHFIAFGTTALLLSSITYNGKLVINLSLLIYLLYLIVFLFRIQPNYIGSSEWDVKQMGLAYSFVPGALFSFTLLIYPDLIFFKKKRFLWRILTFVVFLGCLFIVLFRTVTRGAILISFLGCFFLFLTKQKKTTRILLITLVAVVSLLIILNWESLLETAMLAFPDNEIGVLNKLYVMSQNGNISNGRDSLFYNAVEIFKKGPYIGFGVGYFEKYNQIYAHQLFLQLLCEMGIIGMTLFLIPIVHKIIFIFKAKVDAVSLILIILFCSVLLMLFFSNVYWLLPNFWFLYFLSTRKLKMSAINERTENANCKFFNSNSA